MSDSIHHKLFMVPESAYGTTPATPALATVRHTSCSLALSKESFRSNEIDASRNIKDFRHGNMQIGGDIGVELSYGSFDTLLEMLLMGTWTGDILKIGTTRRSFTAVRQWTDQSGGAKPFHLFTGCEVNKFSLSLTAGKIITGSFGVIGREVNYSASAPTGATFPAVSTTLPFDTFAGELMLDDVTQTVTELSLTVENGLTPNFVLFSPYTERPSNQVCTITGEIGVRFTSAAMLESFLAGSKLSLAFNFADVDGNSYAFDLPQIMLNGGQPDAGGEGPVNLKIPFQAVLDSSLGSTIAVTRVTAP